jgi:protein-S-isoprenylcysteine O-methyltransferase Ste14
MRVLALLAIFPAVVPPYFIVFWSGFAFWRRHRGLWWLMLLAIAGGGSIAITIERHRVLAERADFPIWLNAIGWIVIVAANLLGLVADRQIGFYIRSFKPFFEDNARIELRTGGAYRIVRHPIYAAGIYFQLGAFFATGYYAVAIACAVFTLGALWFTRQEERRLRELLADASEYDRYRARVGALLPRIW